MSVSRTLVPLLLALLLCGALLGTASAKRLHDRDVTVGIDSPITNETADALHLDEVGDALYDTQEGVHEELADEGLEVDHSYLWLCLGDACLPVDPFSVSN